MALTSTTAPGKVFASRAEIAEHYKSDWHKYNLKRREAGLPMLEEADFTARWEAALALRKEKESKAKSGTDHIKASKKKNKKLQKEQQQQKEQSTADEDNDDKPTTPKTPKETAESQENPEIDPRQCLFDSHKSESLKENLLYMQQKYGFFVPDQGEFIQCDCRCCFFYMISFLISRLLLLFGFRVFGGSGRHFGILSRKGKTRSLLPVL